MLTLYSLIVYNWYRHVHFLWTLPSRTKWSELLFYYNILPLEHVLKRFFVSIHSLLLLNFLSNLVTHVFTDDRNVYLFHPLKTISMLWRNAHRLYIFSHQIFIQGWCPIVIVKVQSKVFILDPSMFLCLWTSFIRLLSWSHAISCSDISN